MAANRLVDREDSSTDETPNPFRPVLRRAKQMSISEAMSFLLQGLASTRGGPESETTYHPDDVEDYVNAGLDKASTEANLHMDRSEAAAIYMYTCELQTNNGELSFYSDMNSSLCKRNRKELDPWGPYLRLFLSGLCQVPVIHNRPCYRGVPKMLDTAKKYKPGNTIIFPAFTSTTLKASVLSNPAFLGEEGERTQFLIHGAVGFDISSLSAYGSENETLIPPLATFMVEDVLPLGNGLQQVILNQLKPKEDIFGVLGKAPFESITVSATLSTTSATTTTHPPTSSLSTQQEIAESAPPPTTHNPPSANSTTWGGAAGGGGGTASSFTSNPWGGSGGGGGGGGGAWSASRGSNFSVTPEEQKTVAASEGDRGGCTALLRAAQVGDAPTVERLIKAGNCNPRTECDSEKRTALLIAAEKGHLDVVMRLLSFDKHLIEQQSGNGRTALLWAASNGHRHVVEYLVRNNLSSPGQEVDANLKSALSLAQKGGHDETVQLLELWLMD